MLLGMSFDKAICLLFFLKPILSCKTKLPDPLCAGEILVHVLYWGDAGNEYKLVLMIVISFKYLQDICYQLWSKWFVILEKI